VDISGVPSLLDDLLLYIKIINNGSFKGESHGVAWHDMACPVERSSAPSLATLQHDCTMNVTV
jgi:hypothetical protein